jgi:hypothetical protein
VNLMLGFWSYSSRAVLFNTDRGSGGFPKYRTDQQNLHGWAYWRWGKWYAVWSDGQHMVFQVGKTKLLLSGKIECTNQRAKRARTFVIKQDGINVFELKYRAMDRDWDITFDQLDLELEDFFAWAANVLVDPDAARRWSLP